ncbi:MAG: UDP-glucose 4-epimerase GalE [Methyloligellaceae bacterium]
MNILVTGGAGYIGSHMVYELLDQGLSPVVLDNLTTGNRELVPGNVPFVLGDIGDPQCVEDLLTTNNIEAIVHFAGSIVVPESVADPLKYYLNNTVRSRSLIESAVKCGVRNFIFSSTAAVYGMPEENPVDETASLKPISPYGASKMMTELMLSDVEKAHDLNYTALRYFNVAGADPQGRTGQSTPNATHLIKVASQVALGQRPYLGIFGTDYETEDGTCIRDYIHVSDLAHFHFLALKKLGQGGGASVYNCGYGHGQSVQQVVDAVKRISGVDFEVRLSPRRPGDPAALVARSGKIQQDMNWMPRYRDLDAIVSSAFAWEKSLLEAKEAVPS